MKPYCPLTDIVFKHIFQILNLNLYTPLVRLKSTENGYQLLQTHPIGEKRYQLLQPTHPFLEPPDFKRS